MYDLNARKVGPAVSSHVSTCPPQTPKSHIDDVETPVTFYARLKLAMTHAGRNPKEVADVMGVTDAALRGLKRTRGQARADNAMRAADYLRVNPRWLILGEGEMLGAHASWPFEEITPAQWQALPIEVRMAMAALLTHLIRAHAHNNRPKK